MSRDKEKAKKHSLFSNIFYIFKTVSSQDKWVIPVTLAKAPFEVLLDLELTFFVTVLVWCLENNKGAGAISLVALGVAIFLATVHLVKNKLEEKENVKIRETNRWFDIVLGEKIMNMDFEIVEGPSGRDKYQKAKNSLGKEGIYGFIKNFGRLLTSVIGVFTLGSITASLNPWLIAILTVVQALGIVSTLVENYLVDKTKDPLAKIDRKLNYMTKTSRDFTIAKDIRLFHIREYLSDLSEYFVGERKFWTNKMYFYYFVSDSLNVILAVGIEIGVFAYLIHSVLTGNITKTALALYAQTITDFTYWLSSVEEIVANILPASHAIEDFREFLEIKNEMRNEGGLPIPSDIPYKIEIENLSFTYPETDKVILNNINLTINAGERLALVGVNGAGKTTFVKLLCGLYQPTSGKIKVNGIDIRDLNRDEYYKTVSAVFQEARLMPCTVLENISMLPFHESDIERYEFAARQAGFFDKIQNMPEKENTLLIKSVNENAVELSGGEVQRLLLARAIYKNAPTLILDEPTAALDPIAENEIYLKYSDISENKTSVYISHRLSSTRFCDRIILLDDAKIVEKGPHDKLMALGGKYAEMFNLQKKYYEKEAEEDGAENEENA